MIRRLWGRWEGASELLRAAAKQCLYRHTGRILNPKRSGLLGSLGPADRSRRGRRRCYCRQKDKIPHTTEYFPDARSDRRRSSASCLYPADCVCPPGSPVSTADLAPTLITAARPSDSDRKSFQATLVATAPRSGSCFPAIAAQKTS
jgi:hypothetical protein